MDLICQYCPDCQINTIPNSFNQNRACVYSPSGRKERYNSKDNYGDQT